MLRFCSVVTSSSAREVSQLSWCWCIASRLAWADNSVDICMMAAGSLAGEVFCNTESAD